MKTYIKDNDIDPDALVGSLETSTAILLASQDAFYETFHLKGALAKTCGSVANQYGVEGILNIYVMVNGAQLVMVVCIVLLICL